MALVNFSHPMAPHIGIVIDDVVLTGYGVVLADPEEGYVLGHQFVGSKRISGTERLDGEVRFFLLNDQVKAGDIKTAWPEVGNYIVDKPA